MPLVQRIPNLRELVQPYLGRDYGPLPCVPLVRDLLADGGFVPHDLPHEDVLKEAVEVWWRGDPEDPLELVRPWDWWLCRQRGPAVRHIGLVVDALDFVHVGRGGVGLEPLRRWRPYLVQICRLKGLL